MVCYWGNETEKHSSDILVDDQLLLERNATGKWNRKEFVNEEYAIPSIMTDGKAFITVPFRSKLNTATGGIFYIRLLKKER